MSDPITFKLIPQNVKSSWLADNPQAGETLAGIVIWFKTPKGQTGKHTYLQVQQLYVKPDSARFQDLGASGKLRDFAVCYNIEESAETDTPAQLAIKTDADSVPELYKLLEFYSSSDNTDGNLDFVFFDAGSIETLCTNFEELYLSGSISQLGSLMELPDGETYSKNSKLFTLKLEGAKYTSNAAPGQGFTLGAVCPPKWY
jgi:hypothetical protein